MTSNLARYFETPTQRPRAIVYSPTDEYLASTARCIEHCAARGYHLVGVVTDWVAAQRMLDDRRALVLVVDRVGDLPEDRVPRVDVVADVPPRQQRDPRRYAAPRRVARTRRITRRDVAG